MNERLNVSSGGKWEGVIGYSRAVRVGPYIEVAGTCAADENGAVVGAGDAYAQARCILGKIERALGAAGASLHDVVRTRVFVTDMARWQEVGRAHGEIFGDIRPVSTFVETTALINPDFLVEIEATAIVGQ